MQLDEVSKWDGWSGERHGIIFRGLDRNSGARPRTMRCIASDSVEVNKWDAAGRRLVIRPGEMMNGRSAKAMALSPFEVMRGDLRYERYFRMVEVGVPLVAVCTRMKQNNLMADTIDVFSTGHTRKEGGESEALGLTAMVKKRRDLRTRTKSSSFDGLQELLDANTHSPKFLQIKKAFHEQWNTGNHHQVEMDMVGLPSSEVGGPTDVRGRSFAPRGPLSASRAINVALLLTANFPTFELSLTPPLFAQCQSGVLTGDTRSTPSNRHLLDEAYDVTTTGTTTIGTTSPAVRVGGKWTDSQLRALLEVLPTVKESKLLRQFVETGSSSSRVAVLERHEEFMHSTLSVPRNAAKLASVLYIREFDAHYRAIKAQVSVVNAAYFEAMNSKSLKRALEMILTIGNALNKTDLKAVSVRSLGTLAQTKSQDKTQSVLDVFVKVLVDHQEDAVLNFKKEIPQLEAASKINSAVYLAQLQFLQRGAAALAKEAELCKADERAVWKLEAAEAVERQRKREEAERVAMDREDTIHRGEYMDTTMIHTASFLPSFPPSFLHPHLPSFLPSSNYPSFRPSSFS
jgi:hypothetical protein